MQENTVLDRMSAEFNYPSQYVDVLGSKIHYVEQGAGNTTILLLHGVPTSCYIWRNIIPFLAPLGRCIAPDLIGMGKSDKPDIAYTVEEHIHYIEKFIEAKKLKNITFIMHGWGSIIGFDYAMRHPENCRGLVFYEAYLRPLQGNDLSLPFQEQLVTLQNNNEKMLSSGIHFIEKILPQRMMHKLSPEAEKHYLEPFKSSEAAKFLKQYWNELPRGDGKSKVDKIIANYSEKLTKSQLPKLLLYSIPGFLTTIATVMWAREHLPHLEIGDVGEELHFAPEACPQLMGELISAWLQAVEQS